MGLAMGEFSIVDQSGLVGRIVVHDDGEGIAQIWHYDFGDIGLLPEPGQSILITHVEPGTVADDNTWVTETHIVMEEVE